MQSRSYLPHPLCAECKPRLRFKVSIRHSLPLIAKDVVVSVELQGLRLGFCGGLEQDTVTAPELRQF